MSGLAHHPRIHVPLGQLARFGAVGVSNTIITLAVYAALSALGLPAVLCAVLGWTAGAVNGYRRNRGWTFRSVVRGARPATRYAAVQACAAAANALGVALVVGAGHAPHLAGEVAVLPVVTLATFAVCRRWVFAR